MIKRFAMLGFGGLLVSCTTLLGNDFVIGDEIADGGNAAGGGGAGAAAGSPTGGAGGAGGGGNGGGGNMGGGPPTPLVCDWALAQHTEVERLPVGDRYRSAIHGARKDALSARFFMSRRAAGVDQIDVLTASDTGVTRGTIDAVDPEYVARTGPLSISLIANGADNCADPPDYRLFSVSDSGDGSTNFSRPLFTNNAFPNLDDNACVNAQFVAVGEDFDMVVVYEDAQDNAFEAYARYDRAVGDPVTTVRMTPTNTTQDGQEANPTNLVHLNGITHSFHGGVFDNVAPHHYALSPSMISMPRAMSPLGHAAVFSEASDTGVDIFAFQLFNSVKIRVGHIEESAMSTFQYDPDLHDVGTYASFGEVPVYPAGGLWVDGLLVVVGTVAGKPDTLGYWIIDRNGVERGRAELPSLFMQPTGVNSVQIDAAGVVPLNDDVSNAEGGLFHVLWREDLDDGNATFEASYYNQLRCQPE